MMQHKIFVWPAEFCSMKLCQKHFEYVSLGTHIVQSLKQDNKFNLLHYFMHSEVKTKDCKLPCTVLSQCFMEV